MYKIDLVGLFNNASFSAYILHFEYEDRIITTSK